MIYLPHFSYGVAYYKQFCQKKFLISMKFTPPTGHIKIENICLFSPIYGIARLFIIFFKTEFTYTKILFKCKT